MVTQLFSLVIYTPVSFLFSVVLIQILQKSNLYSKNRDCQYPLLCTSFYLRYSSLGLERHSVLMYISTCTWSNTWKYFFWCMSFHFFLHCLPAKANAIDYQKWTAYKFCVHTYISTFLFFGYSLLSNHIILNKLYMIFFIAWYSQSCTLADGVEESSPSFPML